MLRGPLPQVLVILVLLHGFECRDRRTVRVGLGISGVVLVYAAGFRVDDAIGWWLLAWMVCFGMSTTRLALPDQSPPARAPRTDRRRVGCRGSALWRSASAATIALLAVVPMPDGPARLTLPTFIEDVHDVAVPGAIAAPDGSIRDGTDTGDGTARPPGRPAGTRASRESMDTSVRGAMSDEIVMRVRAPQADFWRGQTFATFDGRRWHADEDAGPCATGPEHRHPAARWVTRRTVASCRSTASCRRSTSRPDMPNVIFAAYRPDPGDRRRRRVDPRRRRDPGVDRADRGVDLHRGVGAAASDRRAAAQRGPDRRAPQPSRAAGARALPGRAREHDTGDDRSRRPAGRRPHVDVRRRPRLRGLDGAATCSTTSTRRCPTQARTPSTTSCSTRGAGSASRSRRRWRSCCARRACRPGSRPDTRRAPAIGSPACTRSAPATPTRGSRCGSRRPGGRPSIRRRRCRCRARAARRRSAASWPAGLSGYVDDHGRQLGARRAGRASAAFAVVALGARVAAAAPPRPMGAAAGPLRCARRAPWRARRRDQRPPCGELDGGRRRGRGEGGRRAARPCRVRPDASTTTTPTTTGRAQLARVWRGARHTAGGR